MTRITSQLRLAATLVAVVVSIVGWDAYAQDSATDEPSTADMSVEFVDLDRLVITEAEGQGWFYSGRWAAQPDSDQREQMTAAVRQLVEGFVHRRQGALREALSGSAQLKVMQQSIYGDSPAFPRVEHFADAVGFATCHASPEPPPHCTWSYEDKRPRTPVEAQCHGYCCQFSHEGSASHITIQLEAACFAPTDASDGDDESLHLERVMIQEG
jgi:hypothetical protein